MAIIEETNNVDTNKILPAFQRKRLGVRPTLALLSSLERPLPTDERLRHVRIPDC